MDTDFHLTHLQEVLLRMMIHVVFSLMCAAAARIEQQLSATRFVFERLVEHEYDQMKETLHDLVPADMIEMVMFFYMQ